MDIFSMDWIGFVITGLGTLFLIGEILVNMRGFFALLGIGCMTVYFAIYLETESLTLMLIIYFTGLLLIVIDGKLINDGTLATLGVASMLIAVALAADNIYAGMYAVIGVLAGGGTAFLLPKVLPKRDMWSKLALKDRLTKEAGYSSINVNYEKLVGKEALTLTDLRPVGTIRIANKDYSAVSNAQWIPKQSRVKVVKVDGTKILVKMIEEESKNSHPPIA